MLLRRVVIALCAATALAVPVAGKEKIKLMYLESEAEVRAAVLINRLDVPLDVHRIGIFRVGKSQFGVIRFGVTDPYGVLADKHRIGATTAMLSDRIFGEIPDLVRIDFEGVSQRETKELKPDVLFSASVDRNSWKTIPKSLVPLERVQMAGQLYFDPRVVLGEPMKPPEPPPKPSKSKDKTRDKTQKRESK
jgi:hypothetical protein